MTDRLSNWKPGDPIGYISPQIPGCEIPRFLLLPHLGLVGDGVGGPVGDFVNQVAG